MNRRHIILLIGFLMVFLLIFKAYSVLAEGCCFKSESNFCEPATQDACTGIGGEFFDGVDCNSVDKCKGGCCCAAAEVIDIKEPWGITQGTCRELLNPPWLEVLETDCNEICAKANATTPVCNENCQYNAKDSCVGAGAKIIDTSVNKYYCWVTDTTYVTAPACGSIGVCVSGPGDCGEGTITELCWCGVNLVDRGYCCFNDKLASDASGCELANDCEKHEEGGPFFKCCDACEDDSLSWSFGDFGGGASDPCPEDKPSCCPECAQDYRDCCDGEWQCSEGDRLSYSYYSCPSPKVACTDYCAGQMCYWGERIDGGANPDLKCECEGEYRCTRVEGSECPVADSRWCCYGNVLSDEECDANTFNLTGYLYDKETGDKITDENNAYVRVVVPLIPPRIYFDWVDESGYYFINYIDASCFEFNVSAMAEGYYTNKTKLSCPSITPIKLTQNFALTRITNICDLSAQPVPNFNAEHVKGESKVRLRWDNPCPEDPLKVRIYSIEKEDEFGSTLDFFYPDVLDTSYVDDYVEWDTTYTYKIRAYYDIPGWSNETSISITTGHEYCEGKFGNEEFCLTADDKREGRPLVKRYRCEDDNSLWPIGTCISGAVCIGPDEEDKTRCVGLTNCEDGGNPFGIYHTKDSCQESLSWWCYYDYSDTSIDECGNCSNMIDDGCYGYESEDSCLDDKCLVAGNCKWFYTFREFGKGICYDEDYGGMDYCDLCNKDAGLFYNVNCDQSVCTKLGSCYSVDSSCESCLDVSMCSDYDSEDSCINAHLQSTSRTILPSFDCPIGVIDSDDACDLGGCRWGDSNGDGIAECFKDSNDDNIADCDEFDMGCEDFEPFTTVVAGGIPPLNAEGSNIRFDLTEGGIGNAEHFYFCIDEDNTCCPKNEVTDIQSPLSNPYVLINPLDESDIITGVDNYFIRYYSIDSNQNVEEVKNRVFFVDPVFPDINIDFASRIKGKVVYTMILIQSDEAVYCDYNAYGIDDKISYTNLRQGFNTTFSIHFEGLGEGGYDLWTNCADSAGNSVVGIYRFYVDFIHGVYAGYPDRYTLNTQTVKFHLTTEDDSECELKAFDASSSGIPYNKLPGEPVDVDDTKELIGDIYNYTETIFNLQKNVSYQVRVTCVSYTGEVDEDFFYFTIDTQAPFAITDFEFGSEAYHKPNSDGNVIVTFDCIDPEINGTPGEAGCKEIRICDVNPSVCASKSNYNTILSGDNWEYSTNEPKQIYYFAVDNAGNEEDPPQRGLIQIDENGPTVVSIIEPTEEFTNQGRVDIKVSALDDPAGSGIDYVEIKIEEVGGLGRVYVRNAIYNPISKLYILNDADLYPGSNLITVRAYDKASNYKDDDHSIYYDVYPPMIGKVTMRDSFGNICSDTSGIPNTCSDPTDNIFEYGENLTFVVEVTDGQGIGVDVSKLRITIYDVDGNVVVPPTGMLNATNNNYYQDITQLLFVGRYNATTEAYDYFSNPNSKTVSFEIRDTKPITLYLKPDITDGITVYTPDLDLTGITEPGIDLNSYLCAGDCFTCSAVGSAVGGPINNPKSTFKNALISDLAVPPGTYPAIGWTSIVWNGILGDNFSVGDLLKFSDHDTYYRVENIYAPELGDTKFDINPAIQKNIVSSTVTVSAYELDKPTGWFELPTIVLNEGDNCVRITGIRTETGNTAPDIFRRITYDSAGLNIVQQAPLFGGILDNPNLNSIIIRVTTDFAADCNITNPIENPIAEQFNYRMTRSGDGKTHSITLDQQDCTSNGGDFCYINNDAATSDGIYHRYTVKCIPDETTMPSDEEEICFGVRTWNLVGGIVSGNNICDGSGGCSGVFPLACQAACTPSCAGIECGNDGCGGSCGTCLVGETCQGGQCVTAACTPSCAGIECGNDGCGGSCGTCLVGETCQGGQCIIATGGPGGLHD